MHENRQNNTVDRFADVQLLRYDVPDFDKLTPRQKALVYYLTEAALWGRDIYFDQNGRYNLRIRKMLEAIYLHWQGDRASADFLALEVYLKRVWFSSGIHHHYGSNKFKPDFSREFLRRCIDGIDASLLPLSDGETVDSFCDEIFPVIFDPQVMPMRVDRRDGTDWVKSSAVNFYEGLTKDEVEAYYAQKKTDGDTSPVSYGLNSRLVKRDGEIGEQVWRVGGMYSRAIEHIVYWLRKAVPVAEDFHQEGVIKTLIEFYRTGDLHTFDLYNILWVGGTDPHVDFVNGFIETYEDPLGMRGSWESIVNFKDVDATRRTEIISANAQWFEDNSPVAARFKKPQVRGVSAKVITAAVLSGDLYPSTAIGINLPNADWIRARFGSKSVTIGNITAAYNRASLGNGFNREFVGCGADVSLVERYGAITDELHTDLHECLGHGSGRLLPGVSSDALKAYGSTIEEARADLFGLYYIADPKLVELKLLPNDEAYKAQYHTYMMNGLLTQLVRIEPGKNIEEAHMRNRALIARWAYEHGRKDKVVELYRRNDKTYVHINDYGRLRVLFGRLLQMVQRIKSTGDFDAARRLVEGYGVKVDPALHREILSRYEALNLAPYKGFVNPRYEPVYGVDGDITDVKVSFDEGYAEQMLRYSRDYSAL